MATSSLRWGRIVLGGVFGELLLIAAVIPMYAGGASESAITVLAVAGSLLAFIPVAWWLARTLPRPILHGVLMGAAAAAIYVTVSVLGGLFVADAPPVPAIYYVGHALKLAGGAIGGWLAGRSAGAAAISSARV
jgi:hypothetical protein